MAIAQQTKEDAEKFGQTFLDKFLHQIQDKCNETERNIRKADGYIFIPHTAFYILIIILVVLFSFCWGEIRIQGLVIAYSQVLYLLYLYFSQKYCSLWMSRYLYPLLPEHISSYIVFSFIMNSNYG